MEIFLAGVDHVLAPLDVRERLAVPRAHVPEAVSSIHGEGWAKEVLLVATCNRTELYTVSQLPDAGARCLRALRSLHPEAPPAASGIYREREGEPAGLHLLRVTAGLESAIVGETEIQGQVKDAHDAARRVGTAGRLLDRLAQAALRAGKRARTETGIAEGGVSHGSATAEVVRRIFGRLKGRRILVLGAGQMAEQTARALAAGGEGSFVVANRTPENAEGLAADLPGGRATGLDELDDLLARVDVAVLAVPGDALDPERMRKVLAARRAPVLLVDVGVPRSAEPSLGRLPGVFLYDLEALEEIVEAAVAERRKHVGAVEQIVAHEFAQIRAWHRTLPALPTIHSLHTWADRIREAELGYLPEDLPPETREAVERMSRRLVQKLLARPAARVRKGIQEEDPTMPTPEHLRSLFGLEEGDR